MGSWMLMGFILNLFGGIFGFFLFGKSVCFVWLASCLVFLDEGGSIGGSLVRP